MDNKNNYGEYKKDRSPINFLQSFDTARREILEVGKHREYGLTNSDGFEEYDLPILPLSATLLFPDSLLSVAYPNRPSEDFKTWQELLNSL